MATQKRPNWLRAAPRTNDLAEIWVDGYGMPLVSAFEPGVDQTDDSTAVYGYTSSINSKTLNNGTLRMTSIMDTTMQTFIDVCNNVDPATTAIKGSCPYSAYIDVSRQRKDPTERYYEFVEIFPRCNVVLPPYTGDPKAKGSLDIDAKTGIGAGFAAPSGKGLAVVTDVIALTKSGSTLTGDFGDYQPTLIPSIRGYENSGKYALLLEVQVRDGATSPCVISKSAILTVTATNVVTGAAKGHVVLDANDLLNTGITVDDTNVHAFVHFLYEVDVAAEPTKNFLLGDGINTRGRFDIP
jgi:hypothetical protein